MWIKKTSVRISVAYGEQLDSEFIRKVNIEFPFFYTPFTKIETLLRLAHKKCQLPNSYQEEKTHFMVWRNGERLCLDDSGRVAKLYIYLNFTECIDLEYVFYNGIGVALDEIEGIEFFYHTKERRHVPHIHARYQGDVIAIELQSQKVIGKFKNRNKQKKAIQYVIENKEKLIKEYNQKTNGIRVFNFEI